MLVVAIVWALVGVLFTWRTWDNYEYGAAFALGGICAPLYLWYALDISYEVVLGIYPISALFFELIALHLSPMKANCSDRKELEKKAEIAKNVDPIQGLSEYTRLLSRGIIKVFSP